MPRLTTTGRLFLAMAIAFYFSALTSQSSLLLLLAGVTLGCLIINFFIARSSVKNLTINVPPVTHLCEGERLTQPWQIANAGKRPAGFIQAESPAGILFRTVAVPG